jgi:hypothetical protein
MVLRVGDRIPDFNSSLPTWEKMSVRRFAREGVCACLFPAGLDTHMNESDPVLPGQS